MIKTLINTEHYDVVPVEPKFYYKQEQYLPSELEIEKFVKKYEIPTEVANLLFFGNKNEEIEKIINNIESSDYYFGRYNFFLVHAYIDITLEYEITDDIVEKFGLRPSYYKLDSEQRGEFIKFLRNPYESTKDISKAFLLFYHLERMLFTTKFKEAIVALIKLLKANNKNKNFVHYCLNSILSRCKQLNDDEMLKYVLVENGLMENIIDISDVIYYSYKLNVPLPMKKLLDNCREFGWYNNRYIKKDYDVFLKTLKDITIEKYGKESINICDIISEDDFLEYIEEDEIGTYSFEKVGGHFSYMDNRPIHSEEYSTIFDNDEFVSKIYELFEKTHETIKNKSKNKLINEKNMQRCGMECKVIDANTINDLTVCFDDGTIVKHTTKQKFLTGTIVNPKLIQQKQQEEKTCKKETNQVSSIVGEKKLMNCGLLATVIEDFGYKNITVQFEDGVIRKNCRRDKFREGKIGHKVEGEDNYMKSEYDNKELEKAFCINKKIDIKNGTKNKKTIKIKKITKNISNK